MSITDDMINDFRIIMKIYWGDICVAIYGYLSEAEFYTDFINEMDNRENVLSSTRIEVQRKY